MKKKKHLSSSDVFFFCNYFSVESVNSSKKDLHNRRNIKLLCMISPWCFLLMLLISYSYGCSFGTIGSKRHPGVSSGSIWRCYYQHVPFHQSAPLRDPGDHHQRHPQTFPWGKWYTYCGSIFLVEDVSHVFISIAVFVMHKILRLSSGSEFDSILRPENVMAVLLKRLDN